MANGILLSQNTAIMLERARRKGFTDEQLLNIIRTEDSSELIRINEEWFTYDDFLSYAKEHGESLEQAVLEGYRITFNTMNGLKIWLQERFGVEEGTDFSRGERQYNGLKLSDANLDALKSTLAANWTVIEEEAAIGSERTVTLAVRAFVGQQA
ncbi:hypothetical protein M3650_09550 [Paenibacillus sp. MER TA 81-3]|uniref:hypothetical protein n=1 Tax=Paenibacillus sp. MER TA 81-3 TaxID=2939573 RepID=UPI00203A804E|nr:hypothetical protein [Paenibacillus sp. MER TA 81-3]MCM3338865.1 hypothetical protein [Paenibacillus sp. MER TA 81-3]